MPNRLKLVLISLFGLLTCSVSSGQKRINSSLTADHCQIKDTQVSIVPPPNFRILSNQMGYADNESGAHVVVEQSDKSFQSVKEYLSDHYFHKKGYKIIEKKQYKINRMPAAWYELNEEFMDRSVVKYILITGNSRGYAMLEALCPSEHPLAAMALKRSLFSVYYAPNTGSDKR
jgi:hypothetical protein